MSGAGRRLRRSPWRWRPCSAPLWPSRDREGREGEHGDELLHSWFLSSGCELPGIGRRTWAGGSTIRSDPDEINRTSQLIRVWRLADINADKARTGARVGSLSTSCKTSAAPPLIADSSPSSDPTISTSVGATSCAGPRGPSAREQPRCERPERAREHDALRVDQRDRGGDADAEELGDLVQGADRPRIAAARQLGDASAGDVSRCARPGFRARAIASWPARVSRHPRPPQRQSSPSNGRTGMWPISPAKPSEPRKSAPSTITAPPMPTLPYSKSPWRMPRSAPLSSSPSAARLASLPTSD